MNDEVYDSEQEWPAPKVDLNTTLVMATILSAKYHPDERFILLHVKLEDGSRRAMPIHASTFGYYHGVKYADAPKILVDREMFKTADLFNARRGDRIRLKVFMEQMQLDGI